jgi:starvation-inducible DNA-binding protein
MSGSHFRDYHLLLDEQADQLFAITDLIAERARKLGGATLHSISDISANQRLADNNEEEVRPDVMLTELCGGQSAIDAGPESYSRDLREA